MFFLLYFFYVLPRHLVVSAHPISEARSINGSINYNSPSGWVNTPHVRGTFDLLISCLTTLSLCAWIAYHPNVPPKTPDIRNFGRQIMWMIIAIFVPEVVLFCLGAVVDFKAVEKRSDRTWKCSIQWVRRKARKPL